MSASLGASKPDGPRAVPEADSLQTADPGASTSLMPYGDIELRDGYAEVGDVRLHYVEAGRGPLVVLLHGFPEFWFTWRLQIAPLAAAGFRVVAPDLRGYNLSSRPNGVEAYTTDRLAADVRGLIRELGADSARLVGHDWGGTIAWATAMAHPEVVERLVILNAAHPQRLLRGLRNPRQQKRLWYFFYFQVPKLPDRRLQKHDWHFFRRYQRDAQPPYTAEESAKYAEAWAQPGAATAMINYYRAALKKPVDIRPITAPTLVIWGQRDRYLGPKLAEPAHDDVPGLARVERLPKASHWVHHDEAQRVNEMLIEFFS
jgi:pimeloyl-ACP methyl ester carboxylesterase